MSNKQKENRINIEDLPQAEREVSPEEAKDVMGGGIVMQEVMVTGYQSGAVDAGLVANRQVNGGDDILIAGPTTYGRGK